LFLRCREELTYDVLNHLYNVSKLRVQDHSS
jgi:hypothetical protein